MEEDVKLQKIQELLNTEDRFCRFNGIRVTVLRPGYAEAEMPITEHSLNGVGIVQGGAIFTLADLAFAGAANSRGFRVVGMSANVSYLRPGSGASLKAVAREVSRGRRTCVCQVEVFNTDGKLVALITSTGFISEQPVLADV